MKGTVRLEKAGYFPQSSRPRLTLGPTMCTVPVALSRTVMSMNLTTHRALRCAKEATIKLTVSLTVNISLTVGPNNIQFCITL